jgi:hypothetical protein
MWSHAVRVARERESRGVMWSHVEPCGAMRSRRETPHESQGERLMWRETHVEPQQQQRAHVEGGALMHVESRGGGALPPRTRRGRPLYVRRQTLRAARDKRRQTRLLAR